MTPEQQTPASVVERLKTLSVRAEGCDEDADALERVASRLERLSAERDGLREALRPFALAADNMDGDEPDTLFIYDSPESAMIDYADLRRARAALTQGESRQTGWQDIATAPVNERILVWVTGKMLPGARFGSAYRGANGKIIAKPEGGNGDWTKEITHWRPLPAAPTPADGGGE
jgi:hypothetical protein